MTREVGGREGRVLHPFPVNTKYSLLNIETISLADTQVTNCNSSASVELKGISMFHLFLVINYASHLSARGRFLSHHRLVLHALLYYLIVRQTCQVINWFSQKPQWDPCVRSQSFDIQMTNKNTDWASEVEYGPSNLLGD